MQLDKYRNMIVDTSALMAFLYKEEGWENAAMCMPKALLSTVNLSEAIKLLAEHEAISKVEALEYIHKVIEKVISFDEEQAGIAGEIALSLKRYGLSLGDRACIAAGIATGLPVLTADRVWKEANLEQVEIILIR